MKKSAKKTVKHATKRTKSKKTIAVYGIEKEFIIITGGGFLVVVMAMLLFFN